MKDSDTINALLTQAQAMITHDARSAARQFALVLDNPDEYRLSDLQRIQLGFSLGLARFASPQLSIPLLDSALHGLHTTLTLAGTLSLPAAKPAIKGAYDADKALTLLNRTLTSLAARDCVAFAFGGVLLGLVRDGCLLPFDKDLDIVVPLNYFKRVCQLLKADGWKRCWVPVQADNFECFVDAETGITLDVFAYAFDQQHIKIVGGWWPCGLQREQGRLLEFLPFAPEIVNAADGRYWRIKNPESVLAQLYGEHWRVPDPMFDSTLESPALVNWTSYTRLWASLKLLEAWTLGNEARINRIQQLVRSKDRADPLGHVFSVRPTQSGSRKA